MLLHYRHKILLKLIKLEIKIDWDKGLTDSEKALISGNYSVTGMTDSKKLILNQLLHVL